MRVKAAALVLLLAGFAAPFALAKGKPPKGGTTTTTAETTTSAKPGKVTICHKAGKSGRWVKVTIGAKAAQKRLAKGDVLPDAAGKCPAKTG
jgi:ABC-type sugar transport system substrate-binding protein